MTQILTLNDLKPEQLKQKRKTRNEGDPDSVSTTLFRAKADTPYAPTAAFNYYPSGESRYSAAHFHEQDQFQIIMEGGGEFGRHHVSPYCVHFSRAYTAYGPLRSDKETGWMFMVLRTRYDSGAQRFPQALEKLKQIQYRQPWQITKQAAFPQPQAAEARLQAIPGIQDEKGLYAGTLSMAPHTQMLAPDPSSGDGQYVVIIKGSLIHDGNERKATGVVFIRPDEQAFEINAGPEGLQAFILNFPKVSHAAREHRETAPSGHLKKWKCALCAFEYDEAAGMPEEGIAAGTRWQDVPETWNCPDCAAGKADFDMVEVAMH